MCFYRIARASLVSQMVKNLPATQEAWVLSLGGEDPLGEDITTHSSILAWRNPVDRGAWRTAVHGVAKSRTWLSDWACMHAQDSKAFGRKWKQYSDIFSIHFPHLCIKDHLTVGGTVWFLHHVISFDLYLIEFAYVISSWIYHLWNIEKEWKRESRTPQYC